MPTYYLSFPLKEIEHARFDLLGLTKIRLYKCNVLMCLQYSSQMVSWYTRRDVVGGVARQLLSGPQVVYYFDKRMPGSPLRVPNSLPPRLSLRLLANYYLLGYGSLLVLMAMFVLRLSFTGVTVAFLFLWVVLMVVRWMLGQAPVVPIISVHDISDSRLHQSFGWIDNSVLTVTVMTVGFGRSCLSQGIVNFEQTDVLQNVKD